MNEAKVMTAEGKSEQVGALSSSSETREAFARLLAEMRPQLHRYCARMTGSVVDGEDVIQDTLVKALEEFPPAAPIANPGAWLFRIAHNTALDFLRHRARHAAAHADEDPDLVVDPVTPITDRQIVAASLRAFMRLPVLQRSSVILMDVLGYSLREISEITESTVPSVKAALHHGRTRLRALAQAPDDLPPPVLAEPERARLALYVDRFNARDFDAIRNLLAADVRLELVARTQAKGRSGVAKYFDNYALLQDWHLVPGFVDRRPAVLVRAPHDTVGAPTYFVLLEWAGERVMNIRDFRFARYVTDGAELVVAQAG